MISRTDAEKWLDEYGKAWIAGDPAAVVKLFHPDATYQETPFDEPMRGESSIRSYWQDGASDSQADVTFGYTLWSVAGDEAFAHWKASFRRVPSGARVDLDGVFRLVFASIDGEPMCVALQEWWHRLERP